MRTNMIFTTYRRTTDGSERKYDTTATLENVTAYMTPLTAEKSAVLGLDYAIDNYSVQTDEQDFKRYDKIVVTFPTALAGDYYVSGLEKHFLNGLEKSRLIINQDQ